MHLVTSIAPVNIAVIKYWGKRDEQLILPINDSVSVTLCEDQMHAKTTVAISPEFEDDRIWLNGKEDAVAANKRLVSCLAHVRKRAKDEGRANWKVHICSENNFPTAAGLASSAAGYACLVYALCKVYEVDGDISALARMGSGSACRSVYGGFVRWHQGTSPDGTDSIATVIKEAKHWSDLKCLILVVNDSSKKVPSSAGMKNSVATSQFLKFRAEKVVPERVEAIIKAIEAKDFDRFARLTMEDSNSFHSVCLDTYPPCVYMKDTSHAICDLVHQINDILATDDQKHLVCYTFDAGPNACLFLPEEHLPVVAGLIQHFFLSGDGNFRGNPVEPKMPPKEVLDRFRMPDDCSVKYPVKYVISTGVGEGPKVLSSAKDHLLDPETGLPRARP